MEMFNKSEASIYLLGYEDRGYIDKLLKAKILGIRKLPLIKTKKVIYKKDLDRVRNNELMEWEELIMENQTLPVSGGKYFTKISQEDYLRVSGKSLCYHKRREKTYVIISWDCLSMPLHRFIMEVESGDGTVIDHINGDTLDNRRENLRVCTIHQNNMNRKMAKNLSGYKGVNYEAERGKFRASIGFNYRRIKIGTFDTATEAAKAYNEKAKELFGEFARLNEIQ